MTDTAQDQLIELFKKAQQTGGDVIAWMTQQVPQLLQQILVYNFLQSTVYIILNTILVIGGVVGAIKTYTFITNYRISKAQSYADRDKWDGLWFSFLAWIPMVLVNIPLFFENLLTMIKIKYAPNLYLLEYFTSLVQTHH